MYKCSLVLERGHNTSHIYSLIISLFYDPQNYILNTNTDNAGVYYLQEIIKSEIIHPITNGISIRKNAPNYIRNIMHFITPAGFTETYAQTMDISDFYTSLIVNNMQYRINISIAGEKQNLISLKYIDISKKLIEKKILKNRRQVANLSELVNAQIKQNIGDGAILEASHLMPVHIHPHNDTFIDIMEELDISNDTSRNNIYRILSLIGKNENNIYYSVTLHKNKWFIAQEGDIPSIRELNMENVKTVQKISREVRFVFYLKKI